MSHQADITQSGLSGKSMALVSQFLVCIMGLRYFCKLWRICSLVAARLGLLCLLRHGIVGLNQTFRNR